MPETATIRCAPLERGQAREAAAWRYPGKREHFHLALEDDADGYHALLHGDELLGYFCLGAPARIDGGRYREPAVDVGMALRPDLTGRGLGVACLKAALAFIFSEHDRCLVRATVAAWNQPALRLCRKLGFVAAGGFGGFRRAAADDYVLLTLRLDSLGGAP